MALMKKTLVERLFNISKISAQTVTNCRISSSTVQSRISKNADKATTDMDLNPGDRKGDSNGNGLFRRFLHKGVKVSPAMRTFLMGKGLKERLKEIDMSKDRIRFDGLSPHLMAKPALPEMVSLSVQEAKKLLRVVQLEVAKALGGLIPLPVPGPNDPRRKELMELEKEKAVIDGKADSLVRRELWFGLAYLVVQTAGFMRLTFWELTWDVMEPICFYVTSLYFMAGYAFFLRTSKEPSFEGFYQSRFNAKQKKLMKANNFDIRRYNDLKEIFYPNSSDPALKMASIDHSETPQIDVLDH